jgi:hypothetical protein
VQVDSVLEKQVVVSSSKMEMDSTFFFKHPSGFLIHGSPFPWRPRSTCHTHARPDARGVRFRDCVWAFLTPRAREHGWHARTKIDEGLVLRQGRTRVADRPADKPLRVSRSHPKGSGFFVDPLRDRAGRDAVLRRTQGVRVPKTWSCTTSS